MLCNIVKWAAVGIWLILISILALSAQASGSLVNTYLVQSDISYGLTVDESQDNNDQPGSSNNIESDQLASSSREPTVEPTLLELSNVNNVSIVNNPRLDPVQDPHEHAD